MNNLSNSQTVCKIKDLCHKLGKIRLKSEYNVKMSLYKDGNAEAPCCSHSIKGETVCKVVKVLAAISLVMLVISTLEEIFCCKKYKR